MTGDIKPYLAAVVSGTTPLVRIQSRLSSMTTAPSGIVGSRLLSNAPQSARVTTTGTVVVVSCSAAVVEVGSTSAVSGVIAGPMSSAATSTNSLNAAPET